MQNPSCVAVAEHSRSDDLDKIHSLRRGRTKFGIVPAFALYVRRIVRDRHTKGKLLYRNNRCILSLMNRSLHIPLVSRSMVALLRAAFLLNIFVCIVRLDSCLAAPVGHAPLADRPFVELVVPGAPGLAAAILYTPVTSSNDPCIEAALAVVRHIIEHLLADFDRYALRMPGLLVPAVRISARLISIIRKCSFSPQASEHDLPPVC
jgi:hypothetical protein